MPLALDGEGCQVAVLFVDGHLPESGREVDRCKDGRVGSADVADALVNFFHGVFVRVGLFVETPEVLHNSKASPPFLWNTENGRVVGGSGLSHYTEPKPLFQRLLHKCLMIRFEWELFVVHWLIVLEIESVFVGFAPSQVRFGYTDHFSVFSQQL